MTEIPEHLLQRSRERRSAMGGGGDAGGDAPAGGGEQAGSAAPAKAAASTPAPSMAAHPAPADEPPAPPPSPMVEAYNRRKKIPYWAMSVLAFIPLWAYVYVGTLDPPPEGDGPELLGEQAYAANGCAGCHGGGGGGGVGPGFSGGAIYETWPNFIDHFDWVRLGSAGWAAERGSTYGANNKPVGSGMPGFGESALSDADLMYIVLHERMGLGGENPNENDALRLELAAELFFEHPDYTLEEVMAEVDAEIPPEGGSGGTEGGNIEGEGDSEVETDGIDDDHSG